MPGAALVPWGAGVLGSLPSPSSNAIHLGPLQVRAYGVCIALGVLAAVWLSSKRWQARGGSAEDFPAIALWAVPAGVVGARLYHVATDWHRFEDRPVEALFVWEGGLGIWGGVALGTLVGAWVARRRGIPVPEALDVVAPALPLAQAIGRVGNWFNQEVFGRPTDLPWALRIDPRHRPDGYEAFATFHPTFLYEALWNLALVGVLLAVDRRRVLRPGGLFAAYVAGYTAARFFIEGLRIDEATMVGPLRINEVVSLVVFAVAMAVVVARRGRPARPAPVGAEEG